MQHSRRALNQCIGRCIRHIDDYGAVIFLDARYERPDSRYKLSGWVQRSLSPSPSHAIQVILTSLQRDICPETARHMAQPSRKKMRA